MLVNDHNEPSARWDHLECPATTGTSAALEFSALQSLPQVAFEGEAQTRRLLSYALKNDTLRDEEHRGST